MKNSMLTQILCHDADTVFTAAIDTEIWRNLCAALAFPEAVAIATTAIAVGAVTSVGGAATPPLVLAVSQGTTAAVSVMTPWLMIALGAITAAAATAIILFGPVGRRSGNSIDPPSSPAGQVAVMEEVSTAGCVIPPPRTRVSYGAASEDIHSEQPAG